MTSLVRIHLLPVLSQAHLAHGTCLEVEDVVEVELVDVCRVAFNGESTICVPAQAQLLGNLFVCTRPGPLGVKLLVASRGVTMLSIEPRASSPQSPYSCLLYTSDAADEEDSVDLGGCRIIKKKTKS
eukprot:TRINITY_DN64079_c0_g1_i1.p2 TRINITY_DN64079_c0_g1~~TRINITY_DN64079_c0_g1_i1.p2  ORF type:complete len:127 (+),score=10.64 TRINITY_DN64079_c0_g1_i1:135-515(+)